MEKALEVCRVQKVYGSRSNITTALNNVSFTVDEGAFVGIMGPSGSGKTTLLNVISTIDAVTTGHIVVGGRDIARLKGNDLARFRREKFGFIFQDFNLLDTLTGYENIALPLTINRVKYGEVERRITETAEQLGISGILSKYPYQMSGGERQRIASARAIIMKPSLILADEPTGALDSKSARMLLQNFECMNAEMGATILLVTHDPFAASYCQRILFLKDGRIFNEIVRRGTGRKDFFERIIEVVTLLGGDIVDAL